MSCQDVCIDMDYLDHGDYPEFASEEIRRARKPHECIECRAEIKVGERHEFAKGRSDGDFWEARTCLSCLEIRGAFVCGGFAYSLLWETIREELFPKWDDVVAIDCLAKLKTKRAVAKMREQYAQYQQDAA